MKEIRAVIRPTRLSKLREAMRALPDGPGMTVVKAQGFTAPSRVQKLSVSEELTYFSDKLLVIVVAPDDRVEEFMLTIQQACTTGQVGDGVIWAIDVPVSMRVTPLLASEQ